MLVFNNLLDEIDSQNYVLRDEAQKAFIGENNSALNRAKNIAKEQAKRYKEAYNVLHEESKNRKAKKNKATEQ